MRIRPRLISQGVERHPYEDLQLGKIFLNDAQYPHVLTTVTYMIAGGLLLIEQAATSWRHDGRCLDDIEHETSV